MLAMEEELQNSGLASSCKDHMVFDNGCGSAEAVGDCDVFDKGSPNSASQDQSVFDMGGGFSERQASAEGK